MNCFKTIDLFFHFDKMYSRGEEKTKNHRKQKNKSKEREGKKMKKNASMIKRFVLTKENIIRNRIECLKMWARYKSAQALEEKYNNAYDIAVKMGCKDYEYKRKLLNKSTHFWKLGYDYVDAYHKAYHELMKLADEGNLWATIYHMDSNFWSMSR